MFNDAVTPGFSNRDKNRPNVVVETEPDYQPHGSGVPVAATEAQGVIQLKKVGHPNGLPAPEQSRGDFAVLLGSLRFNVDPVAEAVHDVECVKLPIPFDVSWTDQIGLVDVVEIESLRKIWIFNSFGNIRSFF